ncbi:MAG: beta-galactosidase [Oscillospiraceae bacterium]|nr:beta-galactosidase [Oscillospiraceae bacterium]
MKRFIAAALAAIITAMSLPMQTVVNAETLVSKKYDFGGLGTASGYIGISASDAYSSAKGCGFSDTSKVENVTADGVGALSDAVRFTTGSSAYTFNVDLPDGVYKITVATGKVDSTSIYAEGYAQLLFMTGNNAVDSFTIPVTDGQLNIYATAGISGTPFSISALEIEQVSASAAQNPTIWTCGDATVASRYNTASDDYHSWAQYLGNYVDTDKYSLHNLSVDGIYAKQLLSLNFFDTVEHYGKSRDIFILAVGVSDYISAYSKNRNNPDATEYRNAVTEMVRRAKAKGMTVYLTKQHTELSDCIRYPLIQTKWFGDVLEEIAKQEQVEILDIFTPWLTFCLEETYESAIEYYTEDGLYMNLKGAEKMAEMVNELLFAPEAPPKEIYDPYKNFDASSAITYETEVSGKAVPNPHKGFVMTVYEPEMFEASFPYGNGGSMNNHAWDITTLVNGVHYWNDINPQEGVYNWKEIDDMLDACEKHGMTYVIRILPYSHLVGSDANFGEEHNFVPKWIYDKGAKKKRVTLKDNPNIELDVPVWDDPIYLQACKDFATAMAEHFDGDPRVELIDIRPFGNWGEWHFSQVNGSEMPSVEIQKDMIKHYKDAFQKTLLAITSDAKNDVYDYALSIGVAKRDDGLIGSVGREWNLRRSYYANMPVLAENLGPYSMMLAYDNNPYGPLKWTETRFRECIEIAHLTLTALDQDGQCGYKFYSEQKDLIDEMVNRIGYNFTVTSAKRNENKLKVTIKNTGVAPAFFNISLCAEITDRNGNKLENFGEPVLIEKGTFHDEDERAFLFEYDGELDENATICLAMYDTDNSLVKGKDPTVKFDNQNTLPTNRLELVPSDSVVGDVNADGVFTIADVVLIQKWLLTLPNVTLPNWKAADLCNDGQLNVSDFSMMKRLLLSNVVR